MVELLFHRPAELFSFAVADLSGKERDACSFVNNFRSVAESHGMQVPDVDVSKIVETVHGGGGDRAEQVRESL